MGNLFWFEYLAGFVKDCHDEQSNVVYELLRFDFIRSGKKGGFPDWYKHNYDKEAHRAALEQNGGVTNARLDFAYSDYDEFAVNPFAEDIKLGEKVAILFMYQRRNVENSVNKQILLKR